MFGFRVYLEVIQKEIRAVLLFVADNTTLPSDMSSACRTISHSIPHYRLLSSSCPTHASLGNGVGHCLPQSLPNLLLCCLQAARPQQLVFSRIHSFLYCALFILERSEQCYQKDTTRKLVNFYVPGSED